MPTVSSELTVPELALNTKFLPLDTELFPQVRKAMSSVNKYAL